MQTTPPFVIEPNNKAVIKETLFEAYLYRRTWTIIHFIELKDLFAQGNEIDKKLQDLKYICSGNQNCTQINALRLLEKRLKIPQQLQNSLFNNVFRKKRGLFNIVGEVHKILWGSLAASDIEYFNAEIDKLYNHTNDAISFVSNETRITQDILDVISTDFDLYNKNIETIKKWAQVEKTNNILIEVILELEIAIDDYRDSLKTYVEGIFHSQVGYLSPLLMPPEKLISSLKELQKIEKFITPTFDINLINYPLILKISDATVYLKNQTRLVTILKVPTAEHDIYRATKFYALDQHVSRQNFRFFILPDIIMFISRDSLHYALENNHLRKCTKGDDISYCKLNSNIFEINNENNCETDLKKISWKDAMLNILNC